MRGVGSGLGGDGVGWGGGVWADGAGDLPMNLISGGMVAGSAGERWAEAGGGRAGDCASGEAGRAGRALPGSGPDYARDYAGRAGRDREPGGVRAGMFGPVMLFS